MTRTAKADLKAIRECPGIGWLREYGKLPPKQRKAILGPIAKQTKDKQTKRAIEAFIRLGDDIAGDRKRIHRLFNWQWYQDHMRDYMVTWRKTRRQSLMR